MGPHARRPAQPAQALAQISSCALPLRKPSRESGFVLGWITVRQVSDGAGPKAAVPSASEPFGFGTTTHKRDQARKLGLRAPHQVEPCLGPPYAAVLLTLTQPSEPVGRNVAEAPADAPSILLAEQYYLITVTFTR